MDHQENNRKDEQKVNERSCHMEDDECPNPREEQNQRECKKYKPHEWAPLWPAMISLFSVGSSASPDPGESLGLHSEKKPTYRVQSETKIVLCGEKRSICHRMSHKPKTLWLWVGDGRRQDNRWTVGQSNGKQHVRVLVPTRT